MMKDNNFKSHGLSQLKEFAGMLIIILFSMHLQATIYTVKQDGSGDFTSIQEAIDSPLVLAMDTILVYPGIYYENLFFEKKCWLGSLYMTTGQEEYIHNTVIDGNHNGTVIYVIQSGANVREINGFTIRNGKNDEGDGGGLNIHNAAKTKIKNCIIKDNECPNDDGGGIYLLHSPECLIQNCSITNNRSEVGSAIFCNRSDDVQLQNLVVTENHSIFGTIQNYSSEDVFLSNVSVYHNHAMFGAGFSVSGYDDPAWVFDPVNRCSSYMNYAAYGTDFYVGTTTSPYMNVYMDTLTVPEPDQSFAYTLDFDGNPQPVNLHILHGYATPVNADIYVNPESGSNSNDGLSPGTAVKTLTYAYRLIAADSLQPKTIHLASGVYSQSTNNEKFPLPQRANINVLGDSIDYPVFDLESSPVFMGSLHYANNISIKNIIIKNADPAFYEYKPIISFYHSKDFSLENVKLINCKTKSRKAIEIIASTGYRISNCEIDSLEGFAFGISDGLFHYNKSAKISKLKITNNFPTTDDDILSGWAVSISAYNEGYENQYELDNIQITRNTAAFGNNPGLGKSAMLIDGNVKAKIVNSTIADNGLAGPQYSTVGALVLHDSAEVEIYNSIFYGDTLDEVVLSGYSQANVDIAYTDIERGENGVHIYGGNMNWLEGNLDTIPYFNDTSAYPYQLRWDSPLIDKGTPMYSEGMEPPYIKTVNGKYCLIGVYGDSIWLPSTDLAGRPRIKGGRIDMGAYEYPDTTTRIRNYYRKEAENFSVKTYPNPFKRRLYIDYRQKEKIKGLALFIYDAKGYEVCSLQEKGSVLANIGRLTWDGKDQWGEEMPPGTYFLYAIAGGRKIFAEKVVKK